MGGAWGVPRAAARLQGGGAARRKPRAWAGRPHRCGVEEGGDAEQQLSSSIQSFHMISRQLRVFRFAHPRVCLETGHDASGDCRRVFGSVKINLIFGLS